MGLSLREERKLGVNDGAMCSKLGSNDGCLEGTVSESMLGIKLGCRVG